MRSDRRRIFIALGFVLAATAWVVWRTIESEPGTTTPVETPPTALAEPAAAPETEPDPEPVRDALRAGIPPTTERFPDEASTDADVPVLGEVRDMDGTSAEGAVVTATPRNSRLRPRTAITDADGRYRLLLPRRVETDRGSQIIAWWLHATLDDRVSRAGTDDLLLERPGLRTVPPLVLFPASRIAGRVIDPEGNPIGGAEVVDEAAQRAVAVTDEEGRFEAPLTWLDDQESVLIAHADGFGASRPPFPTRRVRPGEHWTDIVFVVEPLVPLDGVVVHPDGTPAADVVVQSIRQEDTHSETLAMNTYRFVGIARTDADGRFRVLALRDGELILGVRDGTAFRGPWTFSSRPSAPVRLTIPGVALGPEHLSPVILYVRNAANGAPISPPIEVRLREQDRTSEPLPESSFERPSHGLPPGEVHARIPKSPAELRLVVRRAGFLAAESAPFFLDDDVTPTLHVSLQRGGVAVGTVTSAVTGEAVPFARVRAHPAEGGRAVAFARTARDGSWRLDGLADGVLRCLISDDEYPQTWSPPFAVGPGLPDALVDVVLREGGTIHVRVADQADTPIPGAWIRAYRDELQLQDATDAAGEVRLGPLSAGQWKLELMRDGLIGDGAPPNPPVLVDVIAGAESRHDFVAEEHGAAVVRGVVTRDGLPVLHHEVSLFGADDLEDVWATTEPGGRFVLPPIVPGTYRLEVRRPGVTDVLHRRSITARTGAAPLAIELGSASVTIAVLRRGPATEPLLTSIELERYESDSWRADYEDRIVREGGDCTYTGLPAGRYRVRAVPRSGAEDVVSPIPEFGLAPGGHVRLELGMVPPARLLVHVPPSLPREGTKLVLHHPDGGGASSSLDDDGERIEFEDLPPGPHQLEYGWWVGDDEWHVERRWTIELSGGHRSEFRLPPDLPGPIVPADEDD